MTTAILFGTFFLLIVLTVPIGIAIGLSTLITVIISVDSVTALTITQKAFSSLNSFPLMAIPFFILAGILMAKGGISQRLLDFADAMVGFLTGGLAMITVMTSAFFAAISGSGPATVAAIGSFMIPSMKEKGYGGGFASAITASAGSIGVIIPPSIPFILYGVIGEVSIGKLFLAGILPGILIVFSLMIASYFMIKHKKISEDNNKKFNFKELFKALYNAKWALLAPIVILGGIYGSIFTPTEASAIAVMYSLIVGIFIYKELKWKDIYDSLVETATIVGTVMFLVGLSVTFAYILSLEHIPQKISDGILSFTDNRFIILFLIIIVLLIVGAFIDTVSAIVIFTPILIPIATDLGIDLVHFGVIMVALLAIGYVTPPVGANLFVASQIGKVPIERVFVSAIPLILIMIVAVCIIIAFPAISMYLPNLYN